jgi:CRISPR-associated endonuclease Cas2
MPARDLVLVAYDISSDRRRARALAAVRGFGVDAQLSVHECRFTAGERREMWERLTAIADAGDRLLLLILARAGRDAGDPARRPRSAAPLPRVTP